MKKTNKGIENNSAKVAEKSYEPADYSSTDEIDKGLAITHEQVSDTYMEGTIDGEIDNLEEKKQQFPRKK